MTFKTKSAKSTATPLLMLQVCLKQLIFVQKTNLLKYPQAWGSQNKDKRL